MTEPTKIYVDVVTTNRIARRSWEVLGTIKRVADGSSVAAAFSGSAFSSEPAAIKAGMGNIGIALGNINNPNVVEKFDVDVIEFRFKKVIV